MPIKYPLPDGSDAKILEYQIKAKPEELAAKGHEGIILAKDYRASRFWQLTEISW